LGKKKKLHKKRADGAAQGVGTEFKPHYCKGKTKNPKTKISFILDIHGKRDQEPGSVTHTYNPSWRSGGPKSGSTLAKSL
jgi:hypothetical protein